MRDAKYQKRLSKLVAYKKNNVYNDSERNWRDCVKAWH